MRPPSVRRMTLSVLALLATFGDHAGAYVPSRDPSGRPVTWRAPVFRLALAGMAPRGLSVKQVRDAARRAANTWNEVSCAAMRIEIDDGPAASSGVAEDGANLLVAHNITWCADERGRGCHDPRNPALTNVRFRPAAQGRAEIHEVDIEINAVHYRWDDPSVENGADLQTVLTHELGHALRLADGCRMPGAKLVRDDRGGKAPDCMAASAEARASVMWPLGAPNDLRRRQLSSEDRRAICAMYPTKERRP